MCSGWPHAHVHMRQHKRSSQAAQCSVAVQHSTHSPRCQGQTQLQPILLSLLLHHPTAKQNITNLIHFSVLNLQSFWSAEGCDMQASFSTQQQLPARQIRPVPTRQQRSAIPGPLFQQNLFHLIHYTYQPHDDLEMLSDNPEPPETHLQSCSSRCDLPWAQPLPRLTTSSEIQRR